jgi:hypothetical protein
MDAILLAESLYRFYAKNAMHRLNTCLLAMPNRMRLINAL